MGRVVGRTSIKARSSLVKVKATSGRASASWVTASTAARVSVAWARKNLRRAGVLKNSPRTVTVVPAWRTAASQPSRLPPATESRTPARPSDEVSSSSRDTDAIAGSASPRKPNVPTPIRSTASRILLVAWRDRASSASSRLMPAPSSLTRIRLLPPSAISIRIVRAPASSAFSTSSFTTDAGRSTTSPAAIWSATWGGRIAMVVTAARLRWKAPSRARRRRDALRASCRRAVPRATPRRPRPCRRDSRPSRARRAPATHG